jgi:hypothetical protein
MGTVTMGAPTVGSATVSAVAENVPWVGAEEQAARLNITSMHMANEKFFELRFDGNAFSRLILLPAECFN